MQHSEQIKAVGDALAGTTTVAVLLKWLPAIAAAASLIYTALRIYEWCERRWRAKWPKVK
jgi:hypothetical protein